MKRSILAAVLGVASAVSAFAQGHVIVSNYEGAPYAQIYYSGGPKNNQAVTTADGLTFQVFFGAAGLSSFGSLTPGVTFQIDNTDSAIYDPGAGHGPGGYFLNADQVIPSWSSGAVTLAYTVITPGYTGTSALWQESNLVPTSQAAGFSASVGMSVTPVVVPEPTTMALAGLGAASMLIFRRRK